MAVVTSHLYRCPFDPAKGRQHILGEGINGWSSIRIRPIALSLASGRNDREVAADVTGFSLAFADVLLMLPARPVSVGQLSLHRG